MNHTQQLVNDIKLAHPDMEVSVSPKADTPHVDDESASEHIISIVIDDMAITDPFSSECSRFIVDPATEYGIDTELAKRINEHNGLPVPSPSTSKWPKP